MNFQSLSLFLLSDIHFRRYQQAASDLDATVRSELLIDAADRATETGQIYGIVVCGDVAFSGAASEYNVARRFLLDLCERVKCPPENVWMVPGNHDVDRSVVSQSHLLKSVHAGLRRVRVEFLDAELRKIVDDIQARELVLLPLEHYNLLAAGYGSGCAVDSEKFYWEHNLPLNDGSMLRLRGINSTLVSGPDDNNQANKLLVGEMQTQMLREDGVTHMTICHHPTDWLMDADAVTDALNQRASIQVFGHKHRQRITQIGDRSLIISAGAVQPSREETGWIPTYSILSLMVEGSHNDRYLNVELRSRRWNEADRCFVAEVGEGDIFVRKAKIKLWRWSGERQADTAPARFEEAQQPSDERTIDTDASQKEANVREEVSLMGNSERHLMFRFFGLSYTQIVRIAASLELLMDEDRGVKDSERFQRYFRRAKERGQLFALWNLVEKQYGDGLEDQNPFLSPISAQS